MPENKDIILMHLVCYLIDTNQWKAIRWDGVLSYCLGYYGEITSDHVWAVRWLEQYGGVIK